MKTVKTTLSATLQDYLDVAPGDTDSAKLHWIVNFWASTVDAHRERKKAEEKAQTAPLRLQAVKTEADNAIRDMSTGEDVSAPNVVASATSDSIMREINGKGGAA